MKDQLNSLMSKEMSRKEFVQHIGSGILIFLGVNGLLKAMLHHGSNTSTRSSSVMDYGASAYGGVER